MNVAFALASAIAAAAIVQLAVPGRDVYHSGWFNAVIAAFVVLLLLCVRSPFRALRDRRAKIAGGLAIAGIVAIGFATVASGLLAPDPQFVLGAPGQTVRVDDVGGALSFPLAARDGTLQGDVVLSRAGRGTAIGAWHDAGTFLLRCRMRDVVYVEASDARGAHLTVTQPTGASFLSPVLLMQQQQTMGGMQLPYDSFAIPAAHRIVKAVLFTAQQATRLRTFTGVPSAAVLFAVDDDTDRPIPGAIALARDGTAVSAANVRLRPIVFSYPAVQIVAVPSLLALVLGLVAAIGGTLAAARFSPESAT